MKKRSRKVHYIILIMAVTLFLGALHDVNLLPGFDLFARLPNIADIRQVTMAEDGIIEIGRKNSIVGFPDIAVNKDKEAVIVWQEKTANDYDIYAVRFDAGGVPVADPFRVNQYILSDQKFPRIAMDKAGGFIIVWQSYGEDGSASGVYGQRFRSNGDRWRSEFRVNTTADGNQMSPDVAMSPDGKSVVVWAGETIDKLGNVTKGIYAQRFDADGMPIGNELKVDAERTELKNSPSVGMTDSGDILAVWQSSKGRYWEIMGRSISSAGQPVGGQDLLISQGGSGSRTRPRLAMLPQNQFMAVWEDYTAKEEVRGIILQRESIHGQVLTSQGGKVGKDFDVNTPSFDHQQKPDIAAAPQGVMVVWQAYNKGAIGDDEEIVPTYWSVMGQKLDLSGKFTGEAIQIGTDPEVFQWTPAIANFPVKQEVSLPAAADVPQVPPAQPPAADQPAAPAQSTAPAPSATATPSESGTAPEVKTGENQDNYVVVWGTLELSGDKGAIKAKQYSKDGTWLLQKAQAMEWPKLRQSFKTFSAKRKS